MAYRRRDTVRAAGGLPLLALAGVAAKKLGPKIGARVARFAKSKFGRVAGRAAGAVTVGTIPMPGGSLAQRLGRGVQRLRGQPGARRGRRMNAGNAQAARRAIRRIKAVRNLLKSIEKQLPKRAATTMRKAKRC